jgi:translation initiation factor 1
MRRPRAVMLQKRMARDRDSRLVYSTAGAVEAKRSPEPVATPAGAGKGVRIRLDRRASGRLVTVVTGVPGTGQEVEALGRELRTGCGTGGTTRDHTIELQGDHRDKVEAFLSRRGLRSKRAGG